MLVLFPGDPDALQERAFNYKDKEMIVRGLLDLRTAHKVHITYVIVSPDTF